MADPRDALIADLQRVNEQLGALVAQQQSVMAAQQKLIADLERRLSEQDAAHAARATKLESEVRRLENAHRMVSVFEKPGIIDHPRRHSFVLRQSLADMTSGFEPNRRVAPLTAADEMEQLIVHVSAARRVATRQRRYRLDALPLCGSQHACSVDPE